MENITKHIIFKGRVQGVGFRFTAHNIAKRNMLTGFVRNLPDGSVEMLAQGQLQDIEDCIRDLEETFGNMQIQTNDMPANPKYNDFKIIF